MYIQTYGKLIAHNQFGILQSGAIRNHPSEVRVKTGKHRVRGQPRARGQFSLA